MRILGFISLTVLIVSCSSNSEKNTSSELAKVKADSIAQVEIISQWVGEWRATWNTDPASFAGISGISSFDMNGKLNFTDDKVSIEAYGYEGCAFGEDTLRHTLFWNVRNDSLILTNDENTPGMDYRIKSKSDNKIELQLLEDIFLTLEK